MSNFFLPNSLYKYIQDHSFREDKLLKKLREETKLMPKGHMVIDAEQGQLFQILLRTMNAKKIIEVGVFTGYSSLCMAQALPDEGRLIACDIDETTTAVAKKYWEKAGVDHKIELHLRPAAETMQELIDQGQSGTFDFAFIDGNKRSYDRYYEMALELLRPHGIIAIDDVLWKNRIQYREPDDKILTSLQKFNEKIAKDNRVISVMLPIDGGLTLAIKN